MHLVKYAAFIAILLIFSFVACNEDKSTEPGDELVQQGVETELKTMDETVAQMSSSPMLFALLQFQGISGDLLGGLSLPLTPQLFINSELRKAVPELNDVKLDTNLVAVFLLLETMKGTHSYNVSDSSWSHSDQPADAVVFMYPFMGIDGVNHLAQITISNISLTNTMAQLDMVFAVDAVPAMTMGLDITGSNFIMPLAESTMSKVDLSGTLATASGLSMGYSIAVTETSLTVSMGPGGTSLMTISAEGSNILSSGLSGEPQINSVTMAYGSNLELVVTDMNAESGKVGDVYYQDKDVADLVAENGEIYIEYNSGDKTILSDKMPNTFAMISILGGITG